MKSSYRGKLLFSLLISLFFIIPLIRAIDFSSLNNIVHRANAWYLLAAFCSLALANVIRTYRFRELDHSQAGFIHWWTMNGLYNAATATLPGGTGEAVTAFLIKKAFRMNLAASLRILVFARIMDLGSISGLLFLSSLAVPGMYRELARWLSLLLLSASIVIIVPATEQFFLGILRKVFVSTGKVVSHIRRQIENIASAAEEHGHWKPHVALLHSMGIWVSAAFCLYSLLLAFGIEFTVLQSTYCFGIYALFQIIPLQGFAGIGTQATWWMIALNAAGYRSPDAAAMGLILHGTFYLFIAVLALISVACWRFLGPEKI